MQQVPQSLKIWFIIHFFADIIFAVPLILFPIPFLAFLGFTTIDPLASRLVGAALVGIGTTSLIAKDKGVESCNTLLTLKLMWSSTAAFGILLSIMFNQAPMSAWVFFVIFTLFFFLWLYYQRRLKEKGRKKEGKYL